MSIIIKSNKHFNDVAMIVLSYTTEESQIKQTGDITLISDSKGIIGINVANSSKYFESKEGVHTLDKKQVEFVDKYTSAYQPFFYVGEVLSRETHPTSNKLFVLKIEGHETLTIVTNTLNSLVGTKVVYARVGAVLPSGKPIVLSKVMGVESQGMLCGYKTLGIKSEKDGVVVIDKDIKNGLPFEY